MQSVSPGGMAAQTKPTIQTGWLLIEVNGQKVEGMGYAAVMPLVSERFRQIPLQHCLLSLESQWQSRGQRRS